MKTKIRVISVLISIMLLVSDFAGFIELIFKFENLNKIAIIANADFNYTTAEEYVADCLQKGIVSLEDGTPSGDNIIYRQALNHLYVYDNLAQCLMEDESLVKLSNIWNFWESAASGEFVSAIHSEQELYEAVIMDYLFYEVQSNEYQNKLAEKAGEYTWELYTALIDECIALDKNIVKGEYFADWLNNGGIDLDVVDQAAEDLGWLNTLSDYNTFIENFQQSNAEYIVAMTQVMALEDVDSERIAFLKEMKNSAAENKAFCNALDSIIDKMNVAVSKKKTDFLLLSAEQGIETMGNFAVRYTWDLLVDEVPGFAALKLGVSGFDILLNSGDTASNNAKLILLYTMEQYAKQALISMNMQYLDTPNRSNAGKLNNAFRQYLAYQEYATDWGRTYVTDIVFEGVYNNIINTFSNKNIETYTEYMKCFDSDITFSVNEVDFLDRWEKLYKTYVGYQDIYTALATVENDISETETSEQDVDNPIQENDEENKLDELTVENTRVYNDYVEVDMTSKGRYTINTTGGNPTVSNDDNKKLLYGGDTSFATICIDDSPLTYGSTDFIVQPYFDLTQKCNVSAVEIDGVSIVQKISFVTNPATGRKDLIETRYIITNHDTEEHNVGLRIMYDTMLGSNDNAPFRVPGYGAVTKETEFSGNSIPQFWQAFDSLTNPTVISQGILRNDGELTPDIVQFTNWENVESIIWDYQIAESSENGDSAVSMIWKQKAMKPAETREYVTKYGLSELVQDLLPPLALSAYCPGTINFSYVIRLDNEFLPQSEFDCIAYLENIGDGEATNAYIEIELPDCLSLADGSKERYTFDSLDINSMEQISWHIGVPKNIRPNAGEYTILIHCGADNIEEKTIVRNINLNKNRQDNRIDWGYPTNKVEGMNDNDPSIIWSGVDNLCFLNALKNFNSDKYIISDEYFNMLVKGMNPTVKKYIEKQKNKTWAGSCYGMSCVVALMKYGQLTPSFWNEKAVTAHDLPVPVNNSKIESLINFYHLSQYLPDIQDYSLSSNESENLKLLVQEVSKTKEGGIPLLIGFSWKSNCTSPQENYSNSMDLEAYKKLIAKDTWKTANENLISFKKDDITEENGNFYINKNNKKYRFILQDNGNLLTIIEDEANIDYIRVCSHGHAVVAYDIDTNQTFNNKEYAYRISIWDPNSSETDREYAVNGKWKYLYVNNDFTDWCYETMKANSNTGTNALAIDKNGKEYKWFDLVVSDLNLIDIRNPETGNDSFVMKQYNRNYITNYNDSVATIENSDGQKSEIIGLTSNGDLNITINPNFNETVDGNSINHTRIFLPENESTKSYTVYAKSECLNVDMIYGDYLYEVVADNADNAKFDADGKVQLNGIDVDYTLCMTNDSSNLLWNTIEINGKEANQTSLETTDKGLLLSSNNLLDTKIKGIAYNDNGTDIAEFNIVTAENTVLLAETSEHVLGAFIDKDNDGNFETLIADAKNGINPDHLVVTSGSCGDEVSYTLYKSGLLEVKGNGAMSSDWTVVNSRSTVAWKNYTSQIKKVSIAEGVTTIADWSFYNCSHLEKVELPDSIIKIGGCAFYQCDSLEEITIPKNVSDLYTSSIHWCENLKMIHVDSNNPYFRSEDGVLFNKSMTQLISVPCALPIKKYTIPNSVKEINSDAFYYNSTIQTITIPEPVIEIGSSAFYHCSALKDVSLPDTIREIPYGAFWHCSLLSEIHLPKNLLRICDNAFMYCAFTSFTIPETVMSIDNGAFEGCHSLQKIVIPARVKEIGCDSFYDCESLKEIKFMNPECKIQAYANYSKGHTISERTDSLMSNYSGIIYGYENSKAQAYAEECGYHFELLSEKVDSIICNFDNDSATLTISGKGDLCEYFWSNLSEEIEYGAKKVVIEEGITAISEDAFSRCNNIEEIELPDTLTYIGALSFCGGKLEKVKIPANVVYIGRQAFDYNPISEPIELPQTLAEFEANAFPQYLENVYFSEKNPWFYIEDGVLYNRDKTKLLLYSRSKQNKSFDIPEGVTMICTDAFRYTDNLEKLIIPESVTYICQNPNTISSSVTIYGINDSTAQKYAESYNRKFIDIGAIPSVVFGDVNEDGEVTLKDVVIIRRYIAGGWNVEINEATADVDKDGEVTLKDVVLLRRYIAGGWNVTI